MQEIAFYSPFILCFGLSLGILILFLRVKRAFEAEISGLKQRDAQQEDYIIDDSERISGLGLKFEDLQARFDHLDAKFISKSDKTYHTVMRVLNDAADQSGEGLFLVRHLPQGTYLWKVDKKDVVELSPKEIKQG